MYEHNMKKIFLGEYIKDIDKIVLPQDPLLANKFPTPIMERAACGGIWEALEESEKEKWDGDLYRDCFAEEYFQPLAMFDSKVHIFYYITKKNYNSPCFFQETIQGRQKNIFRVSVYYEPVDFVITKVLDI